MAYLQSIRTLRRLEQPTTPRSSRLLPDTFETTSSSNANNGSAATNAHSMQRLLLRQQQQQQQQQRQQQQQQQQQQQDQEADQYGQDGFDNSTSTEEEGSYSADEHFSNDEDENKDTVEAETQQQQQQQQQQKRLTPSTPPPTHPVDFQQQQQQQQQHQSSHARRRKRDSTPVTTSSRKNFLQRHTDASTRRILKKRILDAHARHHKTNTTPTPQQRETMAAAITSTSAHDMHHLAAASYDIDGVDIQAMLLRARAPRSKTTQSRAPIPRRRPFSATYIHSSSHRGAGLRALHKLFGRIDDGNQPSPTLYTNHVTAAANGAADDQLVVARPSILYTSSDDDDGDGGGGEENRRELLVLQQHPRHKQQSWQRACSPSASALSQLSHRIDIKTAHHRRQAASEKQCNPSGGFMTQTSIRTGRKTQHRTKKKWARCAQKRDKVVGMQQQQHPLSFIGSTLRIDRQRSTTSNSSQQQKYTSKRRSVRATKEATQNHRILSQSRPVSARSMVPTTIHLNQSKSARARPLRSGRNRPATATATRMTGSAPRMASGRVASHHRVAHGKTIDILDKLAVAEERTQAHIVARVGHANAICRKYGIPRRYEPLSITRTTKLRSTSGGKPTARSRDEEPLERVERSLVVRMYICAQKETGSDSGMADLQLDDSGGEGRRQQQSQWAWEGNGWERLRDLQPHAFARELQRILERKQTIDRQQQIEGAQQLGSNVSPISAHQVDGSNTAAPSTAVLPGHEGGSGERHGGATGNASQNRSDVEERIRQTLIELRKNMLERGEVLRDQIDDLLRRGLSCHFSYEQEVARRRDYDAACRVERKKDLSARLVL